MVGSRIWYNPSFNSKDKLAKNTLRVLAKVSNTLILTLAISYTFTSALTFDLLDIYTNINL